MAKGLGVHKPGATGKWKGGMSGSAFVVQSVDQLAPVEISFYEQCLSLNVDCRVDP